MVFFMLSAMAPYAVVAGGSNAQPVDSPALTALRIAGCTTTVIAFCAPVFTLVQPVWKEGSVGDRMVYAHLIALFNSVMWTLYAYTNLPRRILFFIVSGFGIVFQLLYNFFYIYYAEGKKRLQAFLLLSAVVIIAFIIAELVVSMVITHRWSTKFIDVMASASGTSMHIFPVFDVVMVTKSKQINNMNPITPLISFFGASIWITYSFVSASVNYYVLVPNLPGILSAVSQIVVYLIYRKNINNSVKTDAVEQYINELEELPTSQV